MVKILFFALGLVKEPLKRGRTVVSIAVWDGEQMARLLRARLKVQVCFDTFLSIR